MTEDRRWHDAAFDLFGYRIGGSTSHDAIARALREIDEALAQNQDVTITVVGNRDWQDRPMTSLWASLTPEQQEQARTYRGPENHGSEEFKR